VPEVEPELSEVAIPLLLWVPAPVPVPPVADLSGSPLPPVPFVVMPPYEEPPAEPPADPLARPAALCA